MNEAISVYTINLGEDTVEVLKIQVSVGGSVFGGIYGLGKIQS